MSAAAGHLHQKCPVLAILRTAAIFGVEAYLVSVEVDVSDGGLPAITMVRLPDASVPESRDRVQSAIRNSGFEFPRRHVTVNLSPADIRKVGSSFNLPITLGVLAATGLTPTRQIDDVVVLGELSLDGAVRPVPGALPISARARRDGVGLVILPCANAGEAAIVAGLEVVPVTSLEETVAVLTGRRPRPTSPEPLPTTACAAAVDLADVRGQARAARTAVFPARFMLAATMNPCPWGYQGDPRRECRCTPQQIDRYRGRLSGPLRDRIDLCVWVSAVPFKTLTETAPGESSAFVQRRVAMGRQRQIERGPALNTRLNAQLEGRPLIRHCTLDPAALQVLAAASRRFHLSARGCHRVPQIVAMGICRPRRQPGPEGTSSTSRPRAKPARPGGPQPFDLIRRAVR